MATSVSARCQCPRRRTLHLRSVEENPCALLTGTQISNTMRRPALLVAGVLLLGLCVNARLVVLQVRANGCPLWFDGPGSGGSALALTTQPTRLATHGLSRATSLRTASSGPRTTPVTTCVRRCSHARRTMVRRSRRLCRGSSTPAAMQASKDLATASLGPHCDTR